jgi:hypothetical protein
VKYGLIQLAISNRHNAQKVNKNFSLEWLRVWGAKLPKSSEFIISILSLSEAFEKNFEGWKGFWSSLFIKSSEKTC